MEVVDLSNRRGAIVHLLPKVHKLYKQTGHQLKDIVLWTHDMNKMILDIQRKWIFVLDRPNGDVLGFLFYRMGEDGKSLHIEALRVGRHIRAFDLLIQRFQQDNAVKARTEFYASREIQRKTNDEILATVGMQDDSIYDDNGYQHLGDLRKAVDALKVRYQR